MKKLANFTLHDQTQYIEIWKDFGFEIDPVSRAPLIEYEKAEWTEEKILSETYKRLDIIASERFDAIMIGGLSNVMAYAWLYAQILGLEVIMSKTPRLRTPDGKFIFKLEGYAELIKPSEMKGLFMKPKCNLIGQDGNIFNILALASRALKKAKMYDEAKKMQKEVMSSKSYNDALQVIMEYVEIE